jgi:hypothetical protein
MAKAARQAKAGGRGGGRSWLWAQGLACGILVATAAPLAAVLAVVFAPAALAAMAGPLALGAAGEEGGPEDGGRRLAGVMLVYGLAAALPWLESLWGAARDWGMALDLLGGMRLVGVCWGAQAAAWLLSEAAPFVARLVLETQVRARESRLRDARSRLREEWGMEAKGE